LDLPLPLPLPLHLHLPLPLPLHGKATELWTKRARRVACDCKGAVHRVIAGAKDSFGEPLSYVLCRAQRRHVRLQGRPQQCHKPSAHVVPVLRDSEVVVRYARGTSANAHANANANANANAHANAHANANASAHASARGTSANTHGVSADAGARSRKGIDTRGEQGRLTCRLGGTNGHTRCPNLVETAPSVGGRHAARNGARHGSFRNVQGLSDVASSCAPGCFVFFSV
jgi:type VI secretion system secreted protein VgrG